MNAPPKAGVSQAALWTLSFSLLPIMLVYANYPTALPVLKAEWSLANADAGFIYFAFYAGYVVASAVLTGATDYFQRADHLSLLGRLARPHEPDVPLSRRGPLDGRPASVRLRGGACGRVRAGAAHRGRARSA